MSKTSIQELVNKFNSKNPLDKTQKAQKEKDPQFINKMSNIINNQNKANDKKLLTSSVKNSDIKKEKVDEKVREIEREHPLLGIQIPTSHRFAYEKKKILKEKYGIEWRSVIEMNPGVIFD